MTNFRAVLLATFSALSSALIAVYNYSDKDYEDVELSILIRNTDKNKDLKIISKEFQGEKELISDVTEIPLKQPEDNNLKHLKYNIGLANRTHADDPVFIAEIFFEGDIAPEFEVTIHKNGLRGRAFDKLHMPFFIEKRRKEYAIIFVALFMFFLFYTFFILPMVGRLLIGTTINRRRNLPIKYTQKLRMIGA